MNKLNRRDFLQRAAVIGAATVGGAAFLAACKSGGGEGGGFACDDVSALTDAEKATRQGVNYVDASATAGQTCAGCMHFTTAGETACGSCAVVKGPIHPAGWCTLWVATAA